MELFKLFGTIAINNEAANQALADTSEQANDTSKETQEAFSAISGAAGKLVKGFAVAGAALGGAWIAAIEASREYRTEMGKLDTAFQVAGFSSETAKKTYSDFNALLGDSAQATEAAQMLSMLAKNEKELASWTDICTGVYARMGDALPVEELIASSNETAKSGTLTGGLVDALIQAGHSEEEFQKKLDACTSEQQRQDLIMNTLNGSYKKASDQYKETNKDVLEANKAQEKLTDAFAELGRIGEPILTAIKTKVAEMVSVAVPHLENFVNKVKDGVTWVQNNRDTVDKWVAVIIGAGVAIGTFLLILNWGAIMTAAANAVKVVRTAILAMNAAMLANPIALIVALIAGLVAAFLYLWKNNEDFRKFWLNMWDKVRSVASSAVDKIKSKFNDFKAALKTVKNTFGDIKDAISDKLEEAQKKVKSVIDKIKGFFPLSIGKIFSNLKIPKISVSGGKAPFGIAGKGKLPSFSVKWNAQGGILTKATIFGMSGSGQLLGGGEDGPEAVAPISLLQDYVKAAVRSENEDIIRTMIEQNRILMEFLARIVPTVVKLDSGALVGALTPAIDGRLAEQWIYAKRGNTR